jgi:hypothetical protein
MLKATKYFGVLCEGLEFSVFGFYLFEICVHELFKICVSSVVRTCGI